MTNINDIAPAVIAIVLIGIVIGVGVLLLDQFAVATKVSTNQVNDTVTITSGAGTTTNDEITTSTVIVQNHTDIYINQNASTDGRFNITGAGAITTSLADRAYNISYTYLADSAASVALDSNRNATDDFVTWLPVIIIILAAAIILGLVMRNMARP